MEKVHLFSKLYDYTYKSIKSKKPFIKHNKIKIYLRKRTKNLILQKISVCYLLGKRADSRKRRSVWH